MSTTASSLPRSMQLKQRYETVDAAVVEHEDRLTTEDATETWQEIYNLFRATSEDTRDAVKVAVYGYFAVNGTSKVGKYSRSVTAGSETVPVMEVIKKVAKGTVRAFMRSDVSDAYAALKYSGVLESDEVFVAKCKEKGVGTGFAHCAVDFLRGCPDFTVEEMKYAEIAFKSSILRANAARGGRSIESIEALARKERNTVGTSADVDMGGATSDSEL